MELKRSSGIILHPTSLPGANGIGTLGQQAYAFVDFLSASGQKLWQVLPLGPTGYGDSPYQSFSAFAGNPLLVSFDGLVRRGWLLSEDVTPLAVADPTCIDYEVVAQHRLAVLRKAYDRFSHQTPEGQLAPFRAFCSSHREWLDNYALFMALKTVYEGKTWAEWPEQLALHEPQALDTFDRAHHAEVRFHKFVQYVFFTQWNRLKDYAGSKGVAIVGDLPLYVAHDSADCWACRNQFLFGREGNPTVVAGVPPDYFSKTGQRWGNPIYDWESMQADDFAWWVARVRHNLGMYDLLRLDHFRGLAAYWAVPFDHETAEKGHWCKAPGDALLSALQRHLGYMPLIAEDLGVITDDVVHLRERFELPGMKILQFAFDAKEENDFIPHSYTRDCVVYTGTHDNDTVAGWYESAAAKDRAYALAYLSCDESDVAWGFLRGAWASVADMALAPVQDLLGLGSETRMNMPGQSGGNWQWRLTEGQLNESIATRLRALTELYGR